MKNDSLNPVYQVQDIKTSSSPVAWQDYNTVWKDIQNGWVVLWQHHGVFTGKIENGAVSWLGGQPEPDEEHLVRLRAFSDSAELHFWRNKNGIAGRKRTDGEGEGGEFIETEMVLRSVVALPLTTLDTFQKGKAISIRTRNYIGYHPETQQAGYVDSRFVQFIKR